MMLSIWLAPLELHTGPGEFAAFLRDKIKRVAAIGTILSRWCQPKIPDHTRYIRLTSQPRYTRDRSWSNPSLSQNPKG
jgi:hypothetical protein